MSPWKNSAACYVFLIKTYEDALLSQLIHMLTQGNVFENRPCCLLHIVVAYKQTYFHAQKETGLRIIVNDVCMYVILMYDAMGSPPDNTMNSIRVK